MKQRPNLAGVLPGFGPREIARGIVGGGHPAREHPEKNDPKPHLPNAA